MQKNKGFTLVELLTAMAIYSIILVIFSATIITFARINKDVNKKDEFDEVLIIENFLINLYYSKDVTFKEEDSLEDSLLVINENDGTESKLVYENGGLYYMSKDSSTKIASHELITNIIRKQYGNLVVFEIEINSKTRSICFKNFKGL